MVYKLKKNSPHSKEKFLEEVKSILSSAYGGLTPTSYKEIQINRQEIVTLHTNATQNDRMGLVEYLTNILPSSTKETIYEQVVALPNYQVTLILNLSASPNNRKELIELVTALLSPPLITKLNYSGLQVEEIATLTQACSTPGVIIDEHKMIQPEEIVPVYSPISFSSSGWSEGGYEEVDIGLAGDHPVVDYNTH
ncbi:hypothetical protein [Candidatus Tisiphia endosymbiont of Nemotelus uliginosus]|uniref:hypothetical protein n=1 Tax=Candidatus Tisiphia endosymbiont of Nemotelus uliginosus TaxID=3077926 RepID=UPI0035C8FBDC